MAESKGPTTATSANKLAMSRALGAAFLSHQVEQLEKSVTRGPASGNWRDRRQPQADPGHTNRRGIINHAPKQRPSPGNRSVKKPVTEAVPERERSEVKVPKHRKSSEEARGDKDADIVVVDASVLVHALHQVKKWCRDGRDEIVIVPLEALNTLDLLKKGTSPLAQRARSASRILEAQVGTNPRIRVQRDDAFVPWDRIDFKDLPLDDDKDKPTSQPLHLSGSPEWVRRMICCARWEVDHVAETLASTSDKLKVVLAVLSSSAAPAQVGRTETTPEVSSPVPLPAPSPHTHKYEPRSAGLLIGHWATRAGITILDVEPSTAPLSLPSSNHPRNVDEEDRGKRTAGRGTRNSHTAPGAPTARGTGLVERPPAVMQMMEVISQPSKVVRVLARGEKLEPDP
ncbi:uncharacterized protein EDB91DRAFT_1236452 [Suillus paluster]|uniref:uncharacterized protein n=1 Tax=Suillus paluster TaxID=48578 RepID=UPI001B8848A2|nr:uncharacterized protein EDB91DRAFT_1236452 [Suillus paluster]KAG1745036.1 hypothetical protein EDB91DRAFT_1236452 [Suillus paluster]